MPHRSCAEYSISFISNKSGPRRYSPCVFLETTKKLESSDGKSTLPKVIPDKWWNQGLVIESLGFHMQNEDYLLDIWEVAKVF